MMPRNNHTPLPWKIVVDGGATQYIGTQDESEAVAMVHCDGRRKKDGRANAELIVRAVNEREESIAALDRIASGQFDSTVGSIEQVASMRAVARAVLARAKGGATP